MNLWDRLLLQTVLTLNLLRQSNVAPTVSAYQFVNGPFDYNKMPLAPMGCTVQIHESSEQRGTWAANSSDGWYLRTTTDATLSIPKTREAREYQILYTSSTSTSRNPP
jgi:hypothetical protein